VSQQPLIVIRADLGDKVHLHDDDHGGYTLVAGPRAPIGVMYEVVNTLAADRVARAVRHAVPTQPSGPRP
jgi:hypothetical protein